MMQLIKPDSGLACQWFFLPVSQINSESGRIQSKYAVIAEERLEQLTGETFSKMLMIQGTKIIKFVQWSFQVVSSAGDQIIF